MPYPHATTHTFILALSFAIAASAATSSARAADSLATGAPSTTFDLTKYVTGGAVGLGGLTDFRFVPDGRLVMVRKSGEIAVRKTDGTLVAAGSFPVNTTSEQGLLGVEVHPSFATNKLLFFYYSAAGGAGGTDLDRHRIVSAKLNDDNTVDVAGATTLVKGLRGPANHDGGSLGIGPDGKLYIGVGDTGCNSGVAPGGTITNYFGTCLTNGNGKILRVNLDGTIPTDNPLAGVASASACGGGGACGAEGTDPTTTTAAAPRTDIYAWGFRNPWRFWFDSVTGNLWVGDVGEVTYEEITIVQKGKHHGWPYREGAHGYPNAKCKIITPDVGECVDPIYDCKHGTGSGTEDGNCQSITGGQIVDSCDWPATFRGQYFFADNANNSVWTLQVNAARNGIVAGSRKDFGNIATPVSMRTGPDGALYVASLNGYLARIAPKSPVVCTTPDGGPDSGPDSGGDSSVSDTGGTSPDGSAGDSSVTGDGAPEGDGGSTAAPTADSGGCGCVTAGSGSPANQSFGPVLLSGLILSGISAFFARKRRAQK